jgi:hypothetical protein
MAKTMNKRSGHKHKRSGHKRSGHKRSGHKRSGHKRSGLKRTERKHKRVYRKGSKSKTMKGRKDFTTKKSSKVFNRRKHYQKHAKGSRVIRRPYHKKGGSTKHHPPPARYSSDPTSRSGSKTANGAARPKAHTSPKAHIPHDLASKPTDIRIGKYIEENPNDEGQISLNKAGVEELAKDLGIKDYEDKAINLSELKKGQLAKDLGLTKDEVDAKGYAKTFFDDYLKIGDDGTHSKWFGAPSNPWQSAGEDSYTNAPSGNLYLGELAFVDWGFGLPVSKDAYHANYYQ